MPQSLPEELRVLPRLLEHTGAAIILAPEELSQAAAESQEAVDINRELWKANAALAGDDLAKCLMILSMAQKDLSAGCHLVQEAAGVAQSQELRDEIRQHIVGCSAQ